MASIFEKQEPTGNWWKDHSLSLVLFSILFVQLAISHDVTYRAWVLEQQEHNQPVLSRWSSDYTWHIISELSLSLAAEPWGVILPVLLTKWLIERNSSESSG